MEKITRNILVFICAMLLPCSSWAADEQANGKPDFGHLKNNRAKIIAEIDGIKGDVKKKEDNAARISSSASDIENYIKRTNQDILNTERRLKTEAGDKQKIEGNLQYLKDSLARAQDDLSQKTQSEKELTEFRSRLNEKERQLSEIESQINDLLSRDIVAQEFKTKISFYFAMVVALMILGFFGISFYDEKVRITIFSGQAGMQFVTLFSLIIAIILFGITGVLGDKELAALLGGLSGYILGRYNHSDEPPAEIKSTKKSQVFTETELQTPV